MSLLASLERRFAPLVIAACAAWAALACTYAVRLPLIMDEFQGAFSARQLQEGVPYRDFLPYKTLGGYAVHAIPLSLVEDPWASLIATRCVLAVLAAAVLAIAALRLGRLLRPAAVLLGLVLLLACSTWLERSFELRSDALTGLAGLLALVAHLERRPLLAGALASGAFLVSQKGAFACVAAAVAALSWWLCVRRDRDGFGDVLRLALGGVAPVAAYVAAWSVVAPPAAVIEATFMAPLRLAAGEHYQIRHFWFQTLLRNPLPWTLAMLALGLLFARRRTGPSWRDWALLSWGAVFAALALTHRQPWPYFFVIVLPVVFVLAARLLHEEIESGGLTPATWAAILVLGLGLPLSRVPRVLERRSGFQEYNLRLALSVVRQDEPYLAGIELLPGRRHAPASLGWLDSPTLAEVARRDVSAWIAELERDPPKAVVWSYRLGNLPEPLRAWLAPRYERLSGNVYVPALDVPPGAAAIDVRWAGRYRVVSQQPVRVDGRALDPGSRVELAAGPHDAESPSGFRLALFPQETERLLQQRFHERGPLFDDVYGY